MRNLLRGNKLVMVFVSFRWNHHHLGFQLIENRRTITDSVIRLSTLETAVGLLLIAVDGAMVFSLANNAWLEFARSSIEWARRCGVRWSRRVSISRSWSLCRSLLKIVRRWLSLEWILRTMCSGCHRFPIGSICRCRCWFVWLALLWNRHWYRIREIWNVWSRWVGFLAVFLQFLFVLRDLQECLRGSGCFRQ